MTKIIKETSVTLRVVKKAALQVLPAGTRLTVHRWCAIKKLPGNQCGTHWKMISGL